MSDYQTQIDRLRVMLKMYDVKAVVFDMKTHDMAESLLLDSGIAFIYHYQAMIKFAFYSYEDLLKLEEHVNKICLFFQNDQKINEQVT